MRFLQCHSNKFEWQESRYFEARLVPRNKHDKTCVAECILALDFAYCDPGWKRQEVSEIDANQARWLADPLFWVFSDTNGVSSILLAHILNINRNFTIIHDYLSSLISFIIVPILDSFVPRQPTMARKCGSNLVTNSQGICLISILTYIPGRYPSYSTLIESSIFSNSKRFSSVCWLASFLRPS